MFENIKEAIGIVKNRFKATPEEVEWFSVVPCASRDCVYFLTYNISKSEANYFGQFPQALLSCLFCARFNRKDLYLNKDMKNGD